MRRLSVLFLGSFVLSLLLSVGSTWAKEPVPREVEAYGKIHLAKGIKAEGHGVVHVSDGDCAKPGAHIIGSFAAPNGSFGAELFAKPGTDLTFCAALEQKPGAPVRYYGKATGKFHVGAADDEAEFKGVDIEMRQGPPLKLPTVYNPPPEKPGK